MTDLTRLSAQCGEVSEVLKALAHPDRLKLLCLLAEQERTVNELVGACEISQSLASQFLVRLKKEGLVESEKDGQFVRYRIRDLRVLKLVKSLKTIFCG
jgi:DNA-binding transcriptional ArsR family regulator